MYLTFENNSIYNVIYAYSGEADAITKIIDSYSKLENGWNYGEGIAATENTTQLAKHVYYHAKYIGFECEPHPSVDGGINLIFFMNGSDHFLDVMIYPNGTIDTRYEIGRGGNYSVISELENVKIEGVCLQLTEIKSKLCNTSDFSIIEAITLQNNEDSQVVLLQNTEEEYLSF